MEGDDDLPVTLTVERPEELLARHYPNGKLGGLTIDGVCPGALGQRVRLTVQVRRPAREFVLRGQLAWARRVPSPTLPLSFGMDLGPEEGANRVRLLAFARREVSADYTRTERRIELELPVRLVHQGKTRTEHLADLSIGGAFVRTWDPLGLGEQVELLVRPPRALLSTHLKGRVAWVRKTGQHAGMGIEFTDLDGGQRDRVERLLERVVVA